MSRKPEPATASLQLPMPSGRGETAANGGILLVDPIGIKLTISVQNTGLNYEYRTRDVE